MRKLTTLVHSIFFLYRLTVFIIKAINMNVTYRQSRLHLSTVFLKMFRAIFVDKIRSVHEKSCAWKHTKVEP